MRHGGRGGVVVQENSNENPAVMMLQEKRTCRESQDTRKRKDIGVWAAEAWTVENDASPNVDVFDLD